MIKKNIFIVPNEEHNSRIDKCIRRNLGSINQSVLEKSLREKLILLDGKKVKSSQKVQVSQKILYKESLFIRNKDEQFSNKKVEKKYYIDLLKMTLIRETDNWIAINKPNKIAVQGGTNQKIYIDKLLQYISDGKYKLVHRLDKDTSGILLIAKNLNSAQKINTFFKENKIYKLYVAVVSPPPQQNQGYIQTKIDKEKTKDFKKMYNSNEDGKLSKTYFKVYRKMNNYALLGLQPLTGRTHQLRVHMNHIGCSIVGDRKYNIRKSNNNSKELLKLHAYIMKLPTEKTIKANLPKHFMEFLYNNKINVNLDLINKKFLKRENYE